MTRDRVPIAGVAICWWAVVNRPAPGAERRFRKLTLTLSSRDRRFLLIVSVSAPFVGAQIYGFTERVYGYIETGF